MCPYLGQTPSVIAFDIKRGIRNYLVKELELLAMHPTPRRAECIA
jgi:hypothetical protein